jgi:hypothetical protein
MLRLLAGVLANFYLIHLARAAGARLRARAAPLPGEDNNPIR